MIFAYNKVMIIDYRYFIDCSPYIDNIIKIILTERSNSFFLLKVIIKMRKIVIYNKLQYKKKILLKNYIIINSSKLFILLINISNVSIVLKKLMKYY